MRPVDLIPPEDRRGGATPLRGGPLAYVLLGVLVLVLAGVTALVLTGNQIAEREAEIAQLEREDTLVVAKMERLAAYTQFQALSEQRTATIAGLADSRFDWERVMRELALILPEDAWLVSMTATATPEASVGGEGGEGGGSGLRASTAGPALEISGCAKGQEAVAGFVTTLKDIDGVTRVGVQSSELAETQGDGGDGGSDCRTRDFIAKFEVVVAFDAAPVPPVAGAEAAPAAEEEAPSEGSEEG